jgi:hypothetical protein
MIRATVLVVAATSFLGCSGSTPESTSQSRDPCEEIRELEAIAALALDLSPPIDLVRLDISTCTEGTFLDSRGDQREFSINTGWGAEGRVGWAIGPCLHSPSPGPRKPQSQVNPAEGYSIRILLGVWLARSYTVDQLARLPDPRGSCPEPTDLDYLAYHVFRQSADPLSCVITEALLCSKNGREQ